MATIYRAYGRDDRGAHRRYTLRDPRVGRVLVDDRADHPWCGGRTTPPDRDVGLARRARRRPRRPGCPRRVALRAGVGSRRAGASDRGAVRLNPYDSGSYLGLAQIESAAPADRGDAVRRGLPAVRGVAGAAGPTTSTRW